LPARSPTIPESPWRWTEARPSSSSPRGSGPRSSRRGEPLADRTCCSEEGLTSFGNALAAGLVDGFELHIVPILLGAGERLFENVGDLELDQVRAIEAPKVTHVKYRVVR